MLHVGVWLVEAQDLVDGHGGEGGEEGDHSEHDSCQARDVVHVVPLVLAPTHLLRYTHTQRNRQKSALLVKASITK